VSSSGQAAMSFARKPVKSVLKADRLSTEMAQQIVDGQLLAGTVLASENQLGSSYGMSRPHVRQALQRLVAAGLIATRHGLGSYVNTKEQWNLFDPLLLEAFVQSGNLSAIATELVELRKMVEVECCRLAAQRITN
jgi:DNA-binding FadR family transcriptional regulator